MAKDYKAIAASKIRKPGERKPRLLVYARNKKGKTTFGASAPNVLILDPESGADFLPADTADVWPISAWSDLDEVFNYLKTEEALEKYEWIHVDGLTRINNMAIRHVMRLQEERDLERTPGMIQQRDYGKAGELMKGLLFNFQNLPYGIVYTAQERQESPEAVFDEDSDIEDVESRYVPDLPNGVRNAVNGIVDLIGRVYTVKVDHPKNPDVQVTVRRLWVGQSDSLDTGVRSQYKLPDIIKNPTVTKVVNLMQTGKVK